MNERFHFVGGEQVSGQAMAVPRQLQIGGGVWQKDAFPGEVTEELGDGDQALGLRAYGERLTIGFPAVAKSKLIAAYHRGGNVRRFADAEGEAVTPKVFEHRPAGIDGALRILPHAQ